MKNRPDLFEPPQGGRGPKRKPQNQGKDVGKIDKGDDKPDPAACHKALKLLKQYKRLMEDMGKKINDKTLQRLNRLRNTGEITSNDLPGALQNKFPPQFKGWKLRDVLKKCG